MDLKLNKINVLDNIIPINLQDLIQEYIENTHGLVWRIKKDFGSNTNRNNNFTTSPGFQNVFINDLGISDKHFFSLTRPIVNNAFDKLNLKYNEITLGRTFYQMPLRHYEGLAMPHVDTTDPHIVALYYVLDSDGDTVFFNENKEIVKSVTPKKGSVVVFNGNTYHSNYLPLENNRCVINFNVI